MNLSLRTRLCLTVAAVLLVVCLLIAWSTAWVLRAEVDRLHDAQMTQLARRLLTVPDSDSAHMQRLRPLHHLLDDEHGEHGEEGQMTFAVWRTSDGTLLLADHGSRFLHHAPLKIGFQDLQWPSRRAHSRQGHAMRKACKHERGEAFYACVTQSYGSEDKEYWRVLYLEHKGIGVAVGQSQQMRQEMIDKVVNAQILPWLLGLAVLLLGIFWAVRRGLRPLRDLAHEVEQRSADETRPLNTRVPRDVHVLVHELNRLFDRIAAARAREQRFTADAAHELRSPLTALAVQAEVLALCDDEEEKENILAKIQESIDRSGRLIEQLLILAGLDPLTEVERQTIDWQAIAHKVLQNHNIAAREKRIRLKCEGQKGFALEGDPFLIEIMLGNLLNNAIRYAPEESSIRVLLSAQEICVIDEGPGIDPQWLTRVRERFFRPPGQNVAGSGLGLSIVESIAKLHHLELQLENRPQGGLIARILPSAQPFV